MTILVDVTSITDPDCGTIDALAHIQLGARRLGQEVRLVGASEAVLELIEMAGLEDVIGAADERPSGVEMVRQPEEREEAGRVQEEVDAGNPTT